MATLNNASIEYTGGGIYVYSAQLADGTWFITDFQSFDSYGCYDAPRNVVEADILPSGHINYDGHWKNPSFPLPQWIEILQSIRSIGMPFSASDIERHLPANKFCRVGEKELPYDAHSERLETIARFIDVFEDFLDWKGVDIPNDERNEDPCASNIYGTDYGYLSEKIESLLISLGYMEKED